MGQKNSAHSLSAFTQRITIIMFVLAMVVPGVATLFQHNKPKANSEPSKPKVGYERFKEDFQSSFGFRSNLVNARISVANFMSVTPSASVTPGKDGWLYYTNDNEIACVRHAQFDKQHVAKWGRIIESRYKHLQEKGIHYLFIVAPCKHTIYPEYLPQYLRPVCSNSRLDQLIAFLKSNTKVEIMDLREPLMREKKKELLYHLADTHWNARGAFVAYQEIMSRLKKWYPDTNILSMSDLYIKNSISYSDLARISCMDSRIGKADSLLLKKREAQFVGIDGEKLPPSVNIPYLRSKSRVGTIRKAVVFRDSFTCALMTFLPEHFRDAQYYWQLYDPAIVDKEHPDVVIDEMVERRLVNDAPEY